MDIRDANIDDARGIAAVHVASERAAYRGIFQDVALNDLEIDERELTWRARIASRTSKTIVAIHDGKICGWINFGATRDSSEADRTAEIRAMYVSPERWRMGVGTALWNFAKASLNLSYSDVTLWVLESNDLARAFYAKVGFRCESDVEKLVTREGKTLRAVRYRQHLK